jgi:hypothetical protein
MDNGEAKPIQFFAIDGANRFFVVLRLSIQARGCD